MDKISIIIPVYNVERFLKYCLESVINQTYKNLEIILVDDGSTDSSGVICDEYAKKDNRIKVIHKENGGLSSARNIGMKYVTGKYVAFLDSDDCIIPDFYEFLYKLMIKHNCDIVQGNFLRISDDDIANVNNIIEEKNKEIDTPCESVLSNLQALKVLYGVLEKPYIQEVVVWNKLYKKDVFNGIIFPEGKLHEDEFTTHKILFNCNKMVVSNKYIHGYMQTKNSIMRKEISLKRVKDNLGASIEAISFFENKGVTNLLYQIYLRYLCNCIELSGKILKENSEDKIEKLNYIEKCFIDFYEDKMSYIKSMLKTDLDYEITAFKLINNAYNDCLNGQNIGSYWNELNNILQK